HAKAQPILSPVRIDGNAAGTRSSATYETPRSPQFWPAMRKVGLTEVNPLWVLRATAHNTEWMITKIRLLAPSPNHNSASGNRAIAGNGLNMAVSVESRSVPIRVETATVVNTAAMARPSA